MFEITPELIKLVESSADVKKAFSEFMVQKLKTETQALKQKEVYLKRGFDKAPADSDNEAETVKAVKPERF